MQPKIEKTCLCGCGKKFLQNIYYKGYVLGHSQKITRKLMIGDKAPGWKGGILNKRGYVFIFSPNHPHNDGGYVKRSRLVMEKKLGRYLKSWEFVHHINGIKDDDSPKNLFLTSLSEHNSTHRKNKKLNRTTHHYE